MMEEFLGGLVVEILDGSQDLHVRGTEALDHVNCGVDDGTTFRRMRSELQVEEEVLHVYNDEGAPCRFDDDLFPAASHWQDLEMSYASSRRTYQVESAIGVFRPVVVVVAKNCSVGVEARAGHSSIAAFIILINWVCRQLVRENKEENETVGAMVRHI